ncbi:FxDxF family PEP-CTERM protein [Duganella radicis]|nr:FxDxF family PEP-CTERM protein [Duganella radicis]
MALAAGFASADNFQIDAGAITTDVMNPYGHMFTHEVGMFTDTIDFTIPAGSLGSSANPLMLTLGNTNVFSISGLSYSVYGGTAMDGGPWYATYVGNNTTNDLPLSMAGAYHIIVTGTADGTMGGSYAIALVSSVPEPATYGMMLGGIALLAGYARSRKARS